jgi:hypothetical protein
LDGFSLSLDFLDMPIHFPDSHSLGVIYLCETSASLPDYARNRYSEVALADRITSFLISMKVSLGKAKTEDAMNPASGYSTFTT